MRSSISLELGCPVGERWCRVRVQYRGGAAPGAPLLASGTFQLVGGSAREVQVRLTPRGRAATAGRRTPRVTVRYVVADAAGNRANITVRQRLQYTPTS
jgi:hypothetical protein